MDVWFQQWTTPSTSCEAVPRPLTVDSIWNPDYTMAKAEVSFCQSDFCLTISRTERLLTRMYSALRQSTKGRSRLFDAQDCCSRTWSQQSVRLVNGEKRRFEERRKCRVNGSLVRMVKRRQRTKERKLSTAPPCRGIQTRFDTRGAKARSIPNEWMGPKTMKEGEPELTRGNPPAILCLCKNQEVLLGKLKADKKSRLET